MKKGSIEARGVTYVIEQQKEHLSSVPDKLYLSIQAMSCVSVIILPSEIKGFKQRTTSKTNASYANYLDTQEFEDLRTFGSRNDNFVIIVKDNYNKIDVACKKGKRQSSLESLPTKQEWTIVICKVVTVKRTNTFKDLNERKFKCMEWRPQAGR